MKLKTNVPAYYNDISESIRAFIDEKQIELTEDNADITVLLCSDCGISASAYFNGFEGQFFEDLTANDELDKKRLEKHAVKMATYLVLKKALGKQMPWGALTGIRPTKLVREFPLNSESILKGRYDLPQEKTTLLRQICSAQQEFYNIPKDEIDVYLGIPFCKTRCSYCSFSSTDSTKGRKLMEPYVEAIKKEMELCKELISTLGKKVRCIYVGGGTPTALDEDLFDEFLFSVAKHFKAEREFTVEAGRPDTITRKKLEVMKKYGVDRISINPQSMNDETLKKIGRSHSAKDIEECFALAREVGFRTINADLIAGLDGETPEMFFSTLSKVLNLQPENITVHTLAIKHGSKLFEEGKYKGNAEFVRLMVEGAQKVLAENEYIPYYLYRQKYMTGNFENIGYAKPGHIGVYNIDIMEETADIMALGCGGASKRVFKDENRIERAFNFKSIYAYIADIDAQFARKKQLYLTQCKKEL